MAIPGIAAYMGYMVVYTGYPVMIVVVMIVMKAVVPALIVLIMFDGM